VSAADGPLPGFNFRVSWGDRQMASVSSVSALRLDAGVGEEMQPGPVEFARARSGDDAFERWGADPTPQAVTVTILDAGGVPCLTFCSKTPCPSPISPSTGSTLSRAGRHANGWSCDAGLSAG